MCDSNGCRTFCKVLLIIINVIFMLAGLLLLAFGIALVAAPGKLEYLFTSSQNNYLQGIGNISDIVKATGIFMIIVGGVSVLVSIFGFFGAACDNMCLLITYAVILILLLLAEIALIIFAACYPQVLVNEGTSASLNILVNSFKRDVILDNNGNFTNDLNNVMDTGSAGWFVLQTLYQCCGVNGYQDYGTFNWTRATGPVLYCASCSASVIPLSCCTLNNPNSFPKTVNDYVNYNACLLGLSNYNTNGCVNAVETILKKYDNIAIGVAAGLGGLLVILIVLAFIVVCVRPSDKFV